MMGFCRNIPNSYVGNSPLVIEKPYLKYELVRFFVVQLFLLCSKKIKDLNVYSDVKLVVESESALLFLLKCFFRNIIGV